MCTVTFIPYQDGFCFASLRDESPSRNRALAPKQYLENKVKYIAPIDGLAGGTWVGTNDFGHVIILLNGGFENHTRQAEYAKSRGIIVKELLSMSMPVVEWNAMNLLDIEPFTLIVWSADKLMQLVWDGRAKHNIVVDPTLPHLWSSSTLYDEQAKSLRQELFDKWIKTLPIIDKQTMIDFFHTYAHGEDSYIMNRDNKIKTISYTFIECTFHDTPVMHYYDLQNDQFIHHNLDREVVDT